MFDILFASCISQRSNDKRCSIESLVVPSSSHKQPDGPFNAPEIIGGTTLTDILRIHIYDVLLESCTSRLSIDVRY